MAVRDDPRVLKLMSWQVVSCGSCIIGPNIWDHFFTENVDNFRIVYIYIQFDIMY
jgi:hypothetical protein